MLLKIKLNHQLHTSCCKCCSSKYSWRHLSVLCSLFYEFKDHPITDKYKNHEEYQQLGIILSVRTLLVF